MKSCHLGQHGWTWREKGRVKKVKKEKKNFYFFKKNEIFKKKKKKKKKAHRYREQMVVARGMKGIAFFKKIINLLHVNINNTIWPQKIQISEKSSKKQIKPNSEKLSIWNGKYQLLPKKKAW